MKKVIVFVLAFASAVTMLADVPPVRECGAGLKRVVRAEQRQRPADLRRAQAAQEAKMMAGETPATYYDVPLNHLLGKNEAEICAGYVAFDSNGDGKTWKIGGLSTASVCMKPASGTMDDWMISPAVRLYAGKTYMLSLKLASGTTSGKEERLQISMGKAQTVEAMTTDIVPLATATKANTYVDVKQDFSVSEDGFYYFGFHALSEAANSSNTKISTFAIVDKADVVDPPAAGTVSYVLAPKGELKATVSYTAPTVTVDGQELTAIDKVEVKVNGALKQTLTGIAPGEQTSFDVEVENREDNVIELTAWLKDKPGTPCKTEPFYAGLDNPMPVENLKAVLSDDYSHVVLSWDAVGETGESGGYVDPSKVTYYVFDAFGSIYDPAIATTTETGITLDLSAVKGQDFVAFEVTAGMDEYYYSLASVTDIVVVGQPEELPVCESFKDGQASWPWALDMETDYSSYSSAFIGDNELEKGNGEEGSEPEYLTSQDADNGFFLILPVNPDAVFAFQSVKVDVSKAQNPVLEFHYQGMGSLLEAWIAKGAGEFVKARSIDLKEESTSGWTLCRIALDEYKDAPYIRIKFRLVSIHNTETETWSVLMDNIRVRDLREQDLRISAVKAPQELEAGKDVKVSVSVENLGTQKCQGAKVVLSDCTGKVFTAGVPDMEPETVSLVIFDVPTNMTTPEMLKVEAHIDYDADMELSNNTGEAETKMVFPAYPTVSGLSAGTENGKVNLSWTAPDYVPLTQSVERMETFENQTYTPLTISDFGGWTMYDGDGLSTYSFLKDYDNPYRYSPMAFQLFNAEKAGVPQSYRADCEPHTGSNMLFAFSAIGKNDNWLISPLLSGREQTISFFAKSFTIAYPESFEVLYSTTGKNPEDFVTTVTVENYPEDNQVPETWTEFRATLPTEARYFAIRHNSDDTYGLMVDDILLEVMGTLPMDTELLGYDLYRDGVKVNGQLLKECTAVDVPEGDGTYSYSVSAVYNYGASKACVPVEVNVTVGTGLEQPENTAFTIETQQKAIVVKGAAGKSILVHDAVGRLCWSSVAASAERIALPAGVYVVKVGSEVRKVIVR